MKKRIQKILLVVILLLGLRVVHAESYQRWIYWVLPTSNTHQVTPTEMGEITSMLYNGEISPNKAFTLSSGTSLRIPQPFLYLQYIERCVRVIRPSSTPQQVVDAIAGSEKFRWGNDVSLRVKNYWVSDKDKRVVFTDNYSGEDKTVDFLFIDGAPTIKGDCGNPLGVIDFQIKITPKKEEQPAEQAIFSSVIQKEETKWTPPIDLGSALLSMPTQQNQPIPKEENKFNWKPVIWIGGVAVTTGLGYLAYTLLKKTNTSGGPSDPVPPGNTGGGPNDPVPPK